MSILQGSNVLITGGTGSFGKKCVELLLRECPPARLVLLSRDEQKHVEMSRYRFPVEKHPQLRYFVGDVRDAGRLRRALQGIDYVIHAAAMKHVDVAEYNPQECIRTNITGAENLIDACIEAGVKKLVALSTDKAANPVNLYGATKLCSDKLFVAGNALSGRDGTVFSVVRYGNVLGSNGSVIPFFQRERNKGVLPITDPRMTRFVITLEQGVRFVFQAFEQMFGGEIFVPKIPSINITDIAKAVAPECKTHVIGIRPGEKMHECLVPADEAHRTLEFDDFFVIEPTYHARKPDPDSYLSQGRRCKDGFDYVSDSNPEWLTVSELRELIATCCDDPSQTRQQRLRLAG